MKQKLALASLALIAIAVNISGIVSENSWLRRSGELLFFLPLIAYYFKKIHFRNFNFVMFITLAVGATITSSLNEIWYFEQIKMGFWLGSYIFLAREAIKHTEYEKGSRFTTLYFIGVISIYAYLLSIHILEIERNVGDFTFSLYIIYYLNVLLFAIAALVYYLNSFSKKSVFFICLTLSFIFSDVLRDMEIFYFRDLSVEVVASLIRFAALKLVFLFFVTREKKLRLLHLV